jgi:hypothetical protein
MTIRSLVGNACACLGVSVLSLAVLVAIQQDANAGLCTGCQGCSGSTVHNPDGSTSCPGNCTSGSVIWSCDNSCKCVVNAAGTGCNCNPIIAQVEDPA